MLVSRVSRVLVGTALWLLAAVPVNAATVTLAWDANPEPDVTNYNVFVSLTPNGFTTSVPVGNRTTWTFTGLQDHIQYYFAVQAQSPSGLSPFSSIGYVTPYLNLPGSEASRSDFNSDGKLDLLWQNQVNGQLIAWHMNGAAIVGSRFLTPSAVALEWKLRGSGDLNGDGKPDLVWQNTTTGDVGYYLMDGTMMFAIGAFTPGQVGPGWDIASVRDMNGDGKPDILWNEVSTGRVLCWYMNGTTRVALGWINANPLGDSNWKLRGTGDFTGDGQADLVWQNEATGQPLLWRMAGPIADLQIMLPTPGTGDWKIRAIGDANMDGWPDLVFQNVTNGGVVIWAMQGATVFSGPSVGAVGTDWKISAPR